MEILTSVWAHHTHTRTHTHTFVPPSTGFSQAIGSRIGCLGAQSTQNSRDSLENKGERATTSLENLPSVWTLFFLTLTHPQAHTPPPPPSACFSQARDGRFGCLGAQSTQNSRDSLGGKGMRAQDLSVFFEPRVALLPHAHIHIPISKIFLEIVYFRPLEEFFRAKACSLVRGSVSCRRVTQREPFLETKILSLHWPALPRALLHTLTHAQA